MRLILLSLLVAACNPAVDSLTNGSSMEAMIQAATPGALTLDAPPMYAGESVTLSVTGAQPGETVYFGLSQTGVVPQSVCPPILQDCLNLDLPLTLLGSASALRDGTASITIPVPAGSAYGSLFIQAAAFSGTSSAVHRFIEPPDSDCGAGIAPSRCLPELAVDSGWDCGLSESCYDLREVFLTAGTTVDIDITAITGTSVARLAAYGPGDGPGDTNLLTGGSAESECTGQDEDAFQSFTAGTDGVYSILVGRDWGSSAGFSGTYDLVLSASPGLDDLGQVADDDVSTVDSQCGFEVSVAAGWNCGLGESCRDTYAIDLVAGSVVTFEVDDITGGSVPMLALYAPGSSTAGTNLLTGTATDRECVGQDDADAVDNFVVPSTGRYTLAVGRDWGSSAGFGGTYRVGVQSEDLLGALTPVLDDVDSPHADTTCGFSYVTSGSWDCGLGESCQDVYTFDAPAGSTLTIDHTNLTGSSVSRLALFGPGVPLSGVNLLWGSAFDLECLGQDDDQSATRTLTEGGTYRVAVGRDWGSSAGFVGTYDLELNFDEGFPTVSQTIDDGLSEAQGSTCLF